MTAEIAILNKSAVALAADSAVTISAGSKEEKIFNTADKLFELSSKNPIGIMIYNGMSFMEAPLPSLIKQFRLDCRSVDRVEEAATKFLNYLNKFGQECRPELKANNIDSIVNPIVSGIAKKIAVDLQKLIFRPDVPKDDMPNKIAGVVERTITKYEGVFKSAKPALFVGDNKFEISEDLDTRIKKAVEDRLPVADNSQKRRVHRLVRKAIKGNIPSAGHTGIVIAGFGTRDLFPTLISFEIDGMVCDRLKYTRTNLVDIDRLGAKARVIPFAQKEMVERFLYGLDDENQAEIARFCRITLPNIRKKVMENCDFENDEDKAAFEIDIREAERAFLSGLNDVAFDEIRRGSQAEIEGMVEFMPKPELAQMAEALVELTSIKRRVSRGMETVGGPIDVAVISQSEGFVWIKRKHYFPTELNARYLERVHREAIRSQEADDGTDEKSGGAIALGGGEEPARGERRGDVRRTTPRRRRNTSGDRQSVQREEKDTPENQSDR